MTIAMTEANETQTPGWYAVQTMPRHEKKVHAEFEHKSIVSFLPTIERTRRWSDRTKRIEEPLFAGYIFVKLAAEDQSRRVALLRTAGVVAMVGARGTGTSIPDNEIFAIQQVLGSRESVQMRDFLNVGQKVRVRGGALDGVEGILEGFKGEESLIISIELIQRSLSVTVAGYEVEPAA
jgi:transcription antitermination factor NusG